MKKNWSGRALTGMLTAALAVSLAACGTDAPPSSGAAAADPQPAASQSGSAAPAAGEAASAPEQLLRTESGLTLTVVDAGAFTVGVPEGWLALPVQLEGQAQLSCIELYKGAETAADTKGIVPLQILCDPRGLRSSQEETKALYDSTEDLPAEALAALTNYQWIGFSGSGKGNVHAHLEAARPGQEGVCTFGVNLRLSTGGEPVCAVTDEDVQAILGSIALKE